MPWGFKKNSSGSNRLAIYVDAVYNNALLSQRHKYVDGYMVLDSRIYCDFRVFRYCNRAASNGPRSMTNSPNAPYSIQKSVQEFWQRWHIFNDMV